MRQYSKNIQKLFDLGADKLDATNSIDYQELGLNSSHSNELIIVALDDSLHYGDSTDNNHLYAPIHAINTLAQLKISEPFSKIINLLNSYEDDDYLANAIVSYAQILNKDITDNSFSNLANKTISNALNIFKNSSETMALASSKGGAKAPLPTKEIIAEISEEVVVAKEVIVEETPKAVEEVVVTKEVIVEEIPETVEEVVVAKEIKTNNTPTTNAKPQTNKIIEHIAKVGRNEPCPCGSGKKYKRCCMNK